MQYDGGKWLQFVMSVGLAGGEQPHATPMTSELLRADVEISPARCPLYSQWWSGWQCPLWVAGSTDRRNTF